MTDFVKVKGSDDSCIFLESNLCKVHKCKSNVCRMYPFS